MFKNWEISYKYPGFWLFLKNWIVWEMDCMPHGPMIRQAWKLTACAPNALPTADTLKINPRSFFEHVKRCSASLLMWELQSKSIPSHYFPPASLAKIRKFDKPLSQQGQRKVAPHMPGGKASWYSLRWTHRQSCQTTPTLRPINTHSGSLSIDIWHRGDVILIHT